LDPLIFNRCRQADGPPTHGQVVRGIANDTPATSELISKIVIGLREDHSEGVAPA
jgi:hypothetical protein